VEYSSPASRAAECKKQEIAELNARVDKCLANLEDLKSEREKLVKSYAENIDRLVAYFTRRQRENHKRAEKEEEQVNQLYNSGCNVTAKDRENSSYYFSGKASSYENAALKVREFLG
jgi:peptidoglycan hydrolase CwlO-like protein